MFVPTTVAPAMIAVEIKAAINPYSIIVEAFVSFKNFKNIGFP